MTAQREQFVSSAAIATARGVHPRTVERWANAGLIHGAVRTLGGHWRFPLAAVELPQYGQQQRVHDELTERPPAA